MPYDTNKIQANIDGNPKSELYRMVIHLSTLPTLNSNESKRNYEQMNSPVDAEKFLSCSNSPSPLGLQAQECLYSPSVQQVEKNVLESC